ncbi:MAG TPA: MFS transporter, partial [Dehalococcoidia bacterium]|nr:MFS transporter [Dehalococcoidia bacterium]
MTIAGLLILGFGLFLLTLGSIPWLTSQKGKLQTFRALRNRNFRWFWLNGATQSMAQGMQFLVLGWMVLDITSSSYQLGLVIFVYGVPNLLFAMLGGILADRANRLRLLISTRFYVSALIFALAVLKLTDLLEIWHVYTVVAFLGTIQALNMPARQAIVGDMVERDEIMNAVALHTMVNQTGQIIGPAAAGGIIELAGIGPALLVNAGLYLTGIIFLLLIRGLPRQSAAKGATLLADLWAGMQHVRSTPILNTVIWMTLAFAFFALSFRQVMPAFTKEVLEIGAGGTGLLLLAVGLGSLLGNLILAALGDFRRKARLLMASILVQSVVLTLFAWSPWFWASWIML